MKRFMVLLVFLGSLVIGGGTASAKSIDISRTDIMGMDSYGSTYAQAMVINEYGMIIYDDREIEPEYQEINTTAANYWNNAIGRKVFARFSEIGAPESMIDMVISYSDGGSYCDYGYSGVGYGLSVCQLKVGQGVYVPDAVVGGTVDRAYAISTIRHEMGHALGLAHDAGLVMADLGSAQINGDAEMLAAANQMLAMIQAGQVPSVPSQNSKAILNILNNMVKVYNIPGTEGHKITYSFFDVQTGTISGIRFVDFDATIIRNYNLTDFDVHPDGNICGTTLYNGLIGKTVRVEQVLTNRYNFEYYLFRIDGTRYVVNANAFAR